MASLVLKPMIPNLDLMPYLIAVSAFTRSVTLINQYGIFWSAPVRQSATWALSIPQEEEAVCMIKPLLFPFPPRRDALA